MKNNFSKSDKRLLSPALWFTALLIIACQQIAVAQTNTFPSSGNAGVGTTTPLQKLQIGSNTVTGTTTPDAVSMGATYSSTAGANPKLRLFDDNAGSVYGLGISNSEFDFMIPTSARYSWNINGSEKMRLDASGNVGIGTTTPTAAAGYTALSLNNSTGTLIDFMTSNALKARLQSDGTTLYFNNLANGPIQIYTNSTERMRIDSGGNIGIGLTNPQYKLDVAGNINSSATITGNNIVAKYQDVAEWVPSTEQLPAGTVVVLDSTKSNHVIASAQAYDTKVAGVISEQPGITLGERGSNRVLVATTGRVMVKVDATRAPIHVGDLLVTSDVPGLAMKSEPVNLNGIQLHRPGTLIGKALEPLEKGSRTILVLLSLQ